MREPALKPETPETGTGDRPPAGDVQRLAAIDVGTNSVRLLIVEVAPDGDFRVLDDEKVTTRLGEGISRSAALSPAAMDRTVEALGRMAEICARWKVSAVEAIATSAARGAVNRDSFLARVLREVGLPLRVITGEEEADFSFRSIARHFDLEGTITYALDIGGGSTEILLAAGRNVGEIFSIPLGAVRLSERFADEDPLSPEGYRRMRKRVRRELERALGPSVVSAGQVIGCGGTLTTLARMVSLMAGDEHPRVHGFEVPRGRLKHLVEIVRGMTVAERRALPGLHADRADIVLGGFVILHETLRFLGAKSVIVSEQGVREGLVLDMMRRILGREPLGADRAGSRIPGVLEFARSCRFEEPHAFRVRDLALSLFDQLAPLHEVAVRQRDLLEAAALLHDIGYLVNYNSHHRHTYNLVLHARLPGFTPREVELIANVCRYHRRAMPKPDHRNYRSLLKEERRLVRRLASLLRIADGLDRSHSQRVRNVRVEKAGDRCVFHAEGTGDFSLETWTALRKGDLFEKEFGTAVEVLAAAGPGAEAGAGRAPEERASARGVSGRGAAAHGGAARASKGPRK